MSYSYLTVSLGEIGKITEYRPEIIGSMEREGSIIYFKPLSYINDIRESEGFYYINELTKKVENMTGVEINGVTPSNSKNTLLLKLKILFPKLRYKVPVFYVLASHYVPKHYEINVNKKIDILELKKYKAPLYLINNYYHLKGENYLVAEVISYRKITTKDPSTRGRLDYLLE